MGKLLVYIVLAVSVSLSLAHGGEDTLAKICYVPLGVETYVPLTVANIDAHCAHVGELREGDKSLRELQRIVAQAGSGPFVDGLVRAKITIQGVDTIYIDNYGGVMAGSLQYRLDDTSLAKVWKILEKATSPR